MSVRILIVDCLGCELSADYAAIAQARMQREAGLFADISIECTGPATRVA